MSWSGIAIIQHKIYSIAICIDRMPNFSHLRRTPACLPGCLLSAVRGVQPNDVRRLKQVEAENARLKKLVGERDLEIEVMKEVAAKDW